MIRVAVAGLGFMGKAHLGIYSTMPDVRITALCDKDPDNLSLDSPEAGGNISTSQAAYDYSEIPRFSDYNQMLDRGGFDAVDITLPTDLHEEFVTRALRAGYHVFVEKPLAMNYESALVIADAAEASGKVCSVGQCLRFWPLYTEIKKILDSGMYGKIRHAEFGRYSPPPTWAAEGWLGNSSRSGNASMDLHVHDVDIILYLFGRPESVRSVGVPDGAGFYSHISTVYEYPDISVTSTGGWGLSSKYPFKMRAFYALERATIEMDSSNEHQVLVYPFEGEPYPLELSGGDGYVNELEDFISRCESGIPSDLVSPRIIAESVHLTRLEIQSANEGRELKFDC